MFKFLLDNSYATKKQITEELYGLNEPKLLKERYYKVLQRLEKKIKMIGKIKRVQGYDVIILILYVQIVPYGKFKGGDNEEQRSNL